MIELDEIGDWAARFGVPDAQVQRDHLISHLLVALRTVVPAQTVFFGGTALCRTHLPNTRLSEDIDLLTQDPDPLVGAVAKRLKQELRKEFPELAIGPPRRSARSLSCRVTVAGLQAVQLQFVTIEPDERDLIYLDHEVLLRYSDLPATVTWRAPDAASFVVMKMKAWRDRSAPRDLFDLLGMARAGLITKGAHDLLKKTTGVGFLEGDFKGPREAIADAWEPELRHQVGTLPAFVEALDEVRAAVNGVLSR